MFETMKTHKIIDLLLSYASTILAVWVQSDSDYTQRKVAL